MYLCRILIFPSLSLENIDLHTAYNIFKAQSCGFSIYRILFSYYLMETTYLIGVVRTGNQEIQPCKRVTIWTWETGIAPF